MDKALGQKIAKYLGSHYRQLGEGKDIRIVRVYYLGRGARHKNYVVSTKKNKYIVRMSFTKSLLQKREHLGREYRSLKLIESSGIGPKPYIYEKGRRYLGQPFIVIDYITGARLPAHKINAEVIRMAAYHISKLHSITVGADAKKTLAVEVMRPFLIKKISERLAYLSSGHRLSDIMSNALQKANKRVLAMDFGDDKQIALSHGDIAPVNMIRSSSGYKLIDLETLALRSPVFDVAHFFYRAGITKKRQQEFMEEYSRFARRYLIFKYTDNFLAARTFERLIWALAEAFKISEGEREKDYATTKDMRFYLSKARGIFNSCKSLNVIPRDVKWDVKIERS